MSKLLIRLTQLTLLTSLASLALGAGCRADKSDDSAATDGTTTDDSTSPGDDTTDGTTDDGTTDDGTGDDTSTVTSPYKGDATQGLTLTGDRPINVLIVTIDTLRRDALGFYGGATDATPALDRLLQESVVLDNHRSCSNWTYPSMACLFTGRYNELTGFVPRAVDRYPDEPEMMAEILSAAGYQTRAVAAQAVFNNGYNLSQGYQEIQYDTTWGAPDVVSRVVLQATDLVAGGSPWLLHAHFLDPHVPYTAPESYRDKLDYVGGAVDSTSRSFLADMEDDWEGYDADTRAEVKAELWGLYNGDVRYVDEAVGGMMGQLASVGAMDDTLVILMSDHGEQIWDHDRFEHGQDLHVEETRGLAALSAPGLEAGRIDAVTSHVDILPTVLDLLGIDAVPAEVDGAVLGSFQSDRPVFASVANDVEVGQSVEIEGDRLIYWWDGRAAFYELGGDAGEQIDLYPTLDEADDPRLDYLWAVLEPHTEAMVSALGDETATPIE